jgi:hypothetical protein
MYKLTTYTNNDLEFTISTPDGAIYASIGTVATIVQTDEKSITQYVNKTFKEYLEIVSLKQRVGDTWITLLDEQLIMIIIDKYKPSLVDEFREIHLRRYLYQLAGIH